VIGSGFDGVHGGYVTDRGPLKKQKLAGGNLRLSVRPPP
jgi:hypothetical protein